MPDSKYASVHYSKYLELDKILDAQHPRSQSLGVEAHDEMLFIITHQAYELWFKQILYELDSVLDMFREDSIDEQSISTAVTRIGRINEILKVLVAQLRILETMSPLDFLDFRNYLLPASGFQSFQFRKLEAILGLGTKGRITYGKKDYKEPFAERQRKELEAIEEGESLCRLIERWLERTPFLQFGDFNFAKAYRQAVKNMYERERQAVLDTDIPEDHKQLRLRMLQANEEYLNSVFDPAFHQKLLDEGKLKLSHKATMAALFINIYRDEPILQMPYRLLLGFVEMDELLTTWRYRHAQMILRMIGKKMGTGGSVGYDYLKETADKHHLFFDLTNISTLLIPRSEKPELPENLKRRLGFYFSAGK